MKKFLRAKKPEKIFMHWPRKILTREMPTKKFLRRENSLLHPPPSNVTRVCIVTMLTKKKKKNNERQF